MEKATAMQVEWEWEPEESDIDLLIEWMAGKESATELAKAALRALYSNGRLAPRHPFLTVSDEEKEFYANGGHGPASDF